MSELDRTVPPTPGDIRPFEFPEVERAELPMELDVRVARMSRLPVVSVYLFLRAGEAALGEEQAGLAVLTGDALDGGTRKRSGTELAETLDGIGARLGVGAGWEGTGISLSCLADRLEEGLDLLAEVVLEPSFPEDEVTRARDQRLAKIRQRSMDPGSLATDHAMRRFFGPDVPYARPQAGTPDTVGGMDRLRLLGYAGGCYRPGTGGLVVAGDVDGGEVAAMAAERFGDWRGTPPPTGGFAVEPPTRERRVWLVDRPGSVQSEIRVGHVGTHRSDPDYFPLLVLNTLFGGTFTSRLNLNLREKHGFTYGVRSRFGFRSRPGPFYVSTAVGNDVTAPAVREIVGEMEKMVEEGPTEEELAAARDYAAGVFPLRVETATQVARRVAELIVYDLPDDFHDTYRDRIRGVTAEAAGEAGRRHIRPDEAQIVVVGSAEEVGPSLEELDLGPVEVVDAGG